MNMTVIKLYYIRHQKPQKTAINMTKTCVRKKKKNITETNQYGGKQVAIYQTPKQRNQNEKHRFFQNKSIRK